MPELPEVTTIVNDLCASNLIGACIKQVEVFWPRSIATHNIEDFSTILLRQQIKDITRRGKFIVFSLDKDTLLVHLRMTGKFVLPNSKLERTPYERVRLYLDNGQILHYDDQRKFGKWYLLAKPEQHLDLLGIEPLSKDFTLQVLETLLKKSKQQIKSFLLNQKYIAGLGNIYVDEALWLAQIHPSQPASSCNSTQVSALHAAIIKVLKQGIARMGTSLGSKQANYATVSGQRGDNQAHLQVFRRQGEACYRCTTAIIKIKISQRGTHLCPQCQPYFSP